MTETVSRYIVLIDRHGAPRANESIELGILEDHMNCIVGSVGRALRADQLDDSRRDRIIEVIRDAARQIEQILRGR
jgi:hypothetical protein